MTKIRLIRKDNSVLTLDATQYSLNITRSIPVVPMLALAERYALDLNIVTADYKIDVILSDDDCSAAQFEKTAASCSLDFSAAAEDSDGEHKAYGAGDGGSITNDDLDGAVIKIHSAHTNNNSVLKPVEIHFKKTAGATYDTTPPQINVPITQSSPTGVQIATALESALNGGGASNIGAGNALTAGGDEDFTDAFTVTRVAGKNDTGSDRSKIVITSTFLGFDGNNDTPTFSKEFANSKPLFQEFSGGLDRSCKSAGDKLQDLIGFVGNASLLGTSGTMITKEPDKSAIESDFSFSDSQTKDYIIGIQIPYNSLVTSAGETSLDYVERNQVIITGRTDADVQGSEANTRPVNVVFDPKDKTTGISGTVVAMSFNYIAGENVYEGSLTFMPIDMIGGA